MHDVEKLLKLHGILGGMEVRIVLFLQKLRNVVRTLRGGAITILVMYEGSLTKIYLFCFRPKGRPLEQVIMLGLESLR